MSIDEHIDHISNKLDEIKRIIIDNTTTIKAIRNAWDSIEWQSIDKDNMEFTANINTFQKKIIDNAIKFLVG